MPSELEERVDGPATMPSSESGWWEQERATWIRDRILELTTRGAIVLDVGCGRGTMCDGEVAATRRAVRVDSHIWPEWDASRATYVCASASMLPFRPGAFELVGSFDVLEHLADDHAAIAEQARVVEVGGSVVAAVPADQRLWSHHDEAVGHHRRYDAAELGRLARSTGLTVERTTYFFSYLWVPAWLARRSAYRASEPGSGESLAGRTVRRVIAALSAVERTILRRASVPFGTSLWLEARADRPTDARRD